MAKNISWTCPRCGVSKAGYGFQWTANLALEDHQASRRCKGRKKR